MVTVSSNGHFTSLKKKTPRGGRNSQRRAFNHFDVDAATKTRHIADAGAFVSRSECRRCRTSVRASEGEESFGSTYVMSFPIAQGPTSVLGRRS